MFLLLLFPELKEKNWPFNWLGSGGFDRVTCHKGRCNDTVDKTLMYGTIWWLNLKAPSDSSRVNETQDIERFEQLGNLHREALAVSALAYLLQKT